MKEGKDEEEGWKGTTRNLWLCWKSMYPFGLRVLCISVSAFLFFFFFFQRMNSKITWIYYAGDKNHCSCTVAVLFTHLKILKIGPTALFTHLKIILLQCFQFSIFSFSNNKFNPNGPYILGREAPHATPCLGFD